MKNSRSKLQQVMQRASLIDLTNLIDTELLRGAGRRSSPRRSYSGLGRMEAVVKWTPDYPYQAINWGMSARGSPMEKVVIKRTKLINTDWCIAVDASRTMNFATEGDLKLVTASVLSAVFAQSAIKKRDRVTQIVFDEKGIAPILENASAEEMVLITLAHDSAKTRHGGLNLEGSTRTGLSTVMSQLPENQAIVAVVSDFMNITDADKEALIRASHYHTVVCCVVEDAREIRFPKASGQITMQDITTGRRETMTFAQADKLVSQDRAKRVAELIDLFRKARCSYAFFEAGDSTATMRNKLVRLLQNGA